ncbi:MAG TPA: insulinase family protein [Planctomycetota bacterium]|nr:insulinase family protein [Planctomycetota bacterium]
MLRLLFVAAFLSLAVPVYAETAPRPEIIPPFKLWRDVPAHQIKAFKAPVAERFVLDNGLVVFLLEDHELPLIDLSITLRFGDVNEPLEKTGLAEATANVMRAGGSAKYPGDKLDEILEDMAANFSIGIGTDSGSVSLATLREDFDKGLDILIDVLRNPAFPEEKLELWQSQARTAISKRNDSAPGIAFREFRKAVYGEKSPYAKHAEYATVNRIDRAALQEFHRAWFQPNLMIVGVVGAFKKEEMLAKLKNTFGAWPATKTKQPEIPAISTSKKPRALFAERPKITQSTVVLGHVIDLRRDSKEYPAIQLFSEVLSGSMSARLFTEIRTKKGLAYSVGGHAAVQYNRPGLFSFSVQTRNEQALEALDALKEELVKAREQGVTESELADARERIINSFVFNFDSPSKIIGRQMTYELYGYPMDFAERMLEAIKATTLEEVNKAAKKFLDPEKMVVLAVGNSAGLEPGRALASLKNAQAIDVTIPLPQADPMVIDPARETEGRKILAQALKAAGGVEAFREIGAISSDVTLTVRGMRLKSQMRAQLPDSARLDVAGPFGAITQIMTRENAWKASGSSVQELAPAEAKKNLRTLVQSDLGVMKILSAAEEGYNVQALDPTKDGERQLLGVEIESKSLGRVKLWFDAQTHLMARLRYVNDGSTKEYDKTFSDFETVGKVRLAKTISDKDPAGPNLIEMHNIDLNPGLDPAIFTRPEKATPPPK